MELGEDFGKWSEDLARNEDYGIWSTEEDYRELHWNDNADLIIPGVSYPSSRKTFACSPSRPRQ